MSNNKAPLHPRKYRTQRDGIDRAINIRVVRRRIAFSVKENDMNQLYLPRAQYRCAAAILSYFVFRSGSTGWSVLVQEWWLLLEK